MLIYLDNCCYNRPYDDQGNINVFLETQCKLHIQKCIKDKVHDLVTSYILRYESSANPYASRRDAINQFIVANTSLYVGIENKIKIENAAYEIMKVGIKFKDACHISSAIYAHCDYFISTDKRLLKYRTNKIRLVTPVQFVSETEEEANG